MNRVSTVALISATTIAACIALQAAPKASLAQPPAAPNTPPPFEAELLAVAAEYTTWGRVSSVPKMKPTDCYVPPYRGVQRSRSSDTATHGRDLYHLYALHMYDYLDLNDYSSLSSFYGDKPPQISCPQLGQVLVKETFEAIETPYHGRDFKETLDAHGNRYSPAIELCVDHGQQAAWTIGEARELYIMLKLDPATLNTDNGWVYGVVSPDGSRVLASGRIESCMRCHAVALNDRLFGMW